MNKRNPNKLHSSIYIQQEYDKLLAITDAQVRKIKSLEEELEDWKYNLAYFTDEDIATPEGVRTFIGKNFLNDKTVDEVNKLKLYIKELEEDYAKLCSRLQIEEPALYRTCSAVLKPEFKKKIKERIKKYNKSNKRK
jgi:hypothetical protein